MAYSLVVRARSLEYRGREFESRSFHLKPETELREERGLSGCRKGLNTVPLTQALLSLKPQKQQHFFAGIIRISFCSTTLLFIPPLGRDTAGVLLLLYSDFLDFPSTFLKKNCYNLRTCMKTECVICGTTGGLMDPNYSYNIS